MKEQPSLIKKNIPLFIVFILINSFLLIWRLKLEKLNINPDVVIGANCILFIVSCISIALHKKAIENKNPNAVVRSVFLVTLIKLVVIAISVIVYLFLAGSNKNSYGIFCGMILYLIYTIIEVRITLKMKK